MAKIKTTYLCSSNDDTEMQMYVNSENQIYIYIDLNDGQFGYICLDKQTAIKFSKDLKREISYIKESEVSNG